MYLQAETRFGLNLLQTLPVQNESLVFSPISIVFVLAMLHSGARGPAKEQIGDAFLGGATDEQFMDHFSYINKEIRNGKKIVKPKMVRYPHIQYINQTVGVDVYIGNRIYLKNGFTINPSFLPIVSKSYKADAKILPESPTEAVEEINNFIQNATNGKIWNITNEDSIEGSIAFLINALYFKGDWKNPFAPSWVHDGEFTTHSGEKVLKKFMKDYTYYDDYSSDDLFQAIHLKYIDERFEFSIFLPKQKNGLKDALGKLDSGRFLNLIRNRTKEFMNIDIPKFKIETSIDSLKTNLRALGISEIFSETADLSGIAENAYITDGVHKARIEVDEEGTTADAATIMMVNESTDGETEPILFIADHPFLFCLSFEKHPIFLGVLNE